MIDQLVAAGYVERAPDPTDARARLARITDRGRAMVELSTSVVEATEAEWQAHLGEPATRQLRTTLTRLREITDL